MSRPGFLLQDAALGYATRGIPVLPLHYPAATLHSARPVPDGEAPGRPGWSTGCSCGDPGCGQVGKHPLGALVPHGLREATTNRARVLAWWTRYPLANIGLACGHRFDVLDLDGRAAVAALRAFANRHRVALPSGGPVVRTGRPEGGGWHYYLAPTGLGRRSRVLDRVDFQGAGAYVVAPPSRHPTGRAYRWVRDLEHPLPELPAPLRAELERHHHRSAGAVVVRLPVADGPGPRYARAALVEELARVAAARVGRRNHQLWESARNLYNLVATGALDPAEVDRGLLAAAERSGLLTEEPRQTRRTLASAREVGLAHPRRPPEHPSPDHTPPTALPVPPCREDGGRARTRERR